MKPGSMIWLTVAVYATAWILGIGFWAAVIYFGVKLVKHVWMGA